MNKLYTTSDFCNSHRLVKKKRKTIPSNNSFKELNANTAFSSSSFDSREPTGQCLSLGSAHAQNIFLFSCCAAAV